jgi:hypothetical protein
MSWNIDWLDFELREYQESLHNRVHEAYHAAHKVLDDAYRVGKKKLEAELGEKDRPDDDEREWDAQLIDYEDYRWLDQQEALAAMALALLASLTKSFLDEQKGRSLNKSHPPDPKGYGGKGKSQLLKQIDEYKARFGVDLERLECFETVREVELARNSCLHNEGTPTEDYLKFTQKRLLDERGSINVTPKQLDTMIDELSRFGDWLNKAMREVSKAAKPASGA